MSSQDLVDDIARSYTDRVEDLYRTAILATDWSETDVLRIVARRSDPLAFDTVSPTSLTPQYEIERYAGRAPPVSDHAEGERTAEVVTITWPLLERLAADNEEIAEIVRIATPPTG